MAENESVLAKLPALQTEWESGSAAALIKAFVWCAGNGQPFPQWLIEGVFDELKWAREHRPRGLGKTSNSAAHEREQSKHRIRFSLMTKLVELQQMQIDAGQRKRINYAEAAREAQAVMGGKHFAWGTPGEICKSYRRLRDAPFSNRV